MADTTISGLSRILTTSTGAIVPISIGGVTSGIPVSGIITASGDVGGALPIPTGTTAQRPVAPSSGMLRFNTTLNTLEIYNNGFWLGLAQATSSTGTVTTVYNYTGLDVSFTVPAGITSISVKMWGGGGSSVNPDIAGGGSGYTGGTKTVTAGQVYLVSVGGGASIAHVGGYNGGGNVGDNSYNSTYGSGGGGGYSGIFLNNKSFATAVAIAGGGGGGAGQGGGLKGGAGGGTTGSDSAGGGSGNYWGASGGKGGTQTAGGAAGQGSSNVLYIGSQLQGGRGQPSGGYGPGGGGGGGYYGGGGGYGYFQTVAAGGGGGGSGYSGGLTSNINTVQGDNPDNNTGLPGNPNDSDRGGAGQGGKGLNAAGSNGKIIISYTYPQ